jgi:hypothetical protein
MIVLFLWSLSAIFGVIGTTVLLQRYKFTSTTTITNNNEQTKGKAENYEQYERIKSAKIDKVISRTPMFQSVPLVNQVTLYANEYIDRLPRLFLNLSPGNYCTACNPELHFDRVDSDISSYVNYNDIGESCKKCNRTLKTWYLTLCFFVAYEGCEKVLVIKSESVIYGSGEKKTLKSNISYNKVYKIATSIIDEGTNPDSFTRILYNKLN